MIPKPQIEGCKQCGKCCRFSWTAAFIKIGEDDVEKLARFQGAIDGGYMMYWDTPCRYLDLVTNLCKIHDSPDRPEPCKEYGPGDDWYHPDGCTFVSKNHNSRDWKVRNSGAWKGRILIEKHE